MSCLVIIGGGIGCGKTTLLKYLHEYKNKLFCELDNNQFDNENCENRKYEHLIFFNIILDEVCSIQEQEELMKSIRGWRDFRVDLLMAVEYLIHEKSNSEHSLNGPLTRRSYDLYKKLLEINMSNDSSSGDTVFFVEDNFYYRSMRYDWLQIARRNNLGFGQIFVQCPLSTAVHRNSLRGYCIPEEKIKQMLSFFEYPDPVKFKWEKFSLVFDSSRDLQNSNLRDVVDIIMKAQKHPVESVILEDKFEAQSICSKSIMHQADKLVRKLVSRKISEMRKENMDDNDFRTKVTDIIKIRQKFLFDMKQGLTEIPKNIVEKIENLGIGIVSVEFENIITKLFLKNFETEALENIDLYSLKIE